MSGRLWVGQPRDLGYRDYWNRWIRVVPGSDPFGAPGTAIAGRSNLLWATIFNTSDRKSENAAVRFYYCTWSSNPTEAMSRLVGTSFVTLEPHTSDDVLCLTPLVPSSGDHKCLIVVVDDPIVDPLPTGQDWFWYGHISQVGQRNISVIDVTPEVHFLRFLVERPRGDSHTVRLQALSRELSAAEIEAAASSGGRLGIGPRRDDVVQFGLAQNKDPNARGVHQLDVILNPRRLEEVFLVLSGNLGGAASQVIDVEATFEGRRIGGVSVIAARS